MSSSAQTKPGLQSAIIAWSIQQKGPIFCVLLIAGAALGIGAYWMSQTPERLASSKLAALETAKAEEVPLIMQELLGLGDPGIVATVSALESDRPEAVNGARVALREELAKWRHLDPYDGTHRVALLADTLKQRVAYFEPAEKEFAAELATGILLWPIQGESKDRMAIIRDCETVLRDSLDGRALTESYAERDEEYDNLLAELRDQRVAAFENDSSLASISPPPQIDVSIPTDPAETLIPVTSDELGLERFPRTVPGQSTGPDSGEEPNAFEARAPLPIYEASSPSYENSPYGDSSYGNTSEAPVARPELFTPPSNADNQQLPEVIVDANLSGAPQTGIIRNDTMPNEGIALVEPPLPQAELDRSNSTAGDGSTTVHLNYRWLPHIELMQYLHSPDSAISAEAEAELRRRGFTQSQINVSRNVTNPDPSVRLAAIETLTKTSRFDPKPWLRWLCEDDLLEVRGRAISFLATSNEQTDRQFVGRMLQAEKNASLRETIQWR